MTEVETQGRMEQSEEASRRKRVQRAGERGRSCSGIAAMRQKTVRDSKWNCGWVSRWKRHVRTCGRCSSKAPQQRQPDVGRVIRAAVGGPGDAAQEGWGQEDGLGSGAPVDSSAGPLCVPRQPGLGREQGEVE